MNERFRLREDARLIRAKGKLGDVVQVSVPGLERSATLSVNQARVLQLFDGRRSLTEIARAAQSQLRLPISVTELESLVDTLASLQILSTGGGDQELFDPRELALQTLGEDWVGPTAVDEFPMAQQLSQEGAPGDGQRSSAGKLVELARAYHAQGLVEEAQQHVEEALRTAPDDPEALELLKKWAGGDEESGGEDAAGDSRVETDGEDKEEEEEDEEDEEDEEALVEARLRRRRRRRKRALLAVAIGGGLIGLMSVVPYELSVNEQCTLVPTKRVIVRSRLKGLVRQVFVKEGALVRKGQILLQLDDYQLHAAKKKVEAKLRKAKAELAKLKRGARREEIAQARQAVSKKSTEVRFARRAFKRAARLQRQGLVSTEKLDNASRDLAVRVRELGVAQAALRLLQAGSREEIVQAKLAEIAQHQAEFQLNERLLAETTVKSPIAGSVVTPRIEEKVNTHVDEGAEICEIVDTSRMRAEVSVPEREADAIRLGLNVEVKVRSYPERSFHGKVTFIAPKIEKGEFTNFVRVITVLRNPERLLKPEMTGQARIFCGPRSILSLVTRRILRWIRVEFVV